MTEGDICDPAAVATSMAGADQVVHTVAVVAEGGEMDLFRRVNVEGTEIALAGARAAGARQAVHLSSVMVYGFRYPDGVREDGPMYEGDNPYCVTKRDGDRLALAAHDPDGMHVTVLRPGDVYGPGSVPWVQRPLALMRRGLFALPDGGQGVINHLHVENLVDAVFTALTSPDAGGRAFNITDGVATTCREYFTRLAATAGLRPPRTLPTALMRPAFRALHGVYGLLGRPSPASPEAIQFLLRRHRYDIGHAARVLGYAPRVSLGEGLDALAVAAADTGHATSG